MKGSLKRVIKKEKGKAEKEKELMEQKEQLKENQLGEQGRL